MDSSEMTPTGTSSLANSMADAHAGQNGTILPYWWRRIGRGMMDSLSFPGLILWYVRRMKRISVCCDLLADIQAYTSSILSFLFTNVGKPILITGAQIPLSQSRSDGWDNILDSLVVAGVLDFAGVGVVFNHHVLQGNR